jgi:hypothetical protein
MGSRPLGPLRFPALNNRVAVLSGKHTETSLLLVGLARRQWQQGGKVLCLDASRHQQTEVQFRLLLRQQGLYQRLVPSSEVPLAMAQTALRVVSHGLTDPNTPLPLLLFDGVRETWDWERTVQFLLNAGATIVEVLPEPQALLFGRYDTTILLGAASTYAEAASRAVGRKVVGEDIVALRSGEAYLVHLAQVYRVAIPQAFADKGD